MSTQTSNMKVEQVGFLLERLAEDCAPLQYVRELTQNAIEAIQRLEDSAGGEIYWSVNPYMLEEHGVQKLSITDTGVGMSEEEMIQHINHLSSSGGLQSLSGNYGLGAKISAATRNKAGIVYASWQHELDAGTLAWLWRDPVTGQYGLKRQEIGGKFCETTVPDERLKPELIQKAGHGTVVILMGDDMDQNTFAPEGMGTEWVAKYLEERYFTFPENIVVRAQDSKSLAALEDEPGIGSRPVYGRQKALTDLSGSNGRVELRGATANWWVLSGDAKTKAHSTRRFGGYAAALYQDELYEPTANAARRPRLQAFGCTFSYNDVVIFVEPHSGKQLTTNTARTLLLLGGEPLPWDDWANEFRNKLPQDIRDLEEAISASTVSGHKDSIQQRLAKIMTLFKLSRYRPVARGGTHDILTETLGRRLPIPILGEARGQEHEPDPAEPPQKPRIAIVKNNNKRDFRLGVAAKEGTTAVEVESERFPWPEVRWLPPPELDESLADRAAYYEPKSNTIMANPSFRVFTDMEDYWKKQYQGVPSAKNKIEDTVREGYEQQLIETVVGLLSLRNRECWTQEQIEAAWSAEGLTSAVMPRSQILIFVAPKLRMALGSKAADRVTVDAA
jgi:hypothetical protein